MWPSYAEKTQLRNTEDLSIKGVLLSNTTDLNHSWSSRIIEGMIIRADHAPVNRAPLDTLAWGTNAIVLMSVSQDEWCTELWIWGCGSQWNRRGKGWSKDGVGPLTYSSLITVDCASYGWPVCTWANKKNRGRQKYPTPSQWLDAAWGTSA